MSKVREWMASDTITAASDDTVAAVATRMAKNRVGAVLVVDKGVLHGLFSERDLLTRVVAQGRDAWQTRIGEVASHPVVTIEADAPLKKVLQLFRDKGFRHLAVMDKGHPVGILSTRDFLGYLVEGFERLIEQGKYVSTLADGVDPYDHIGGGYGR